MKKAARKAGHGFVLCLCVALAGCAATTEKMIYHGERKTYDAHLQDNLDVGAVVGGQETSVIGALAHAQSSEISNEVFAGALKQSLANQGLLANDGRGRYVLNIQLVSVDQAFNGLNSNVVTSVQYVLTDTQSHTVVMKETIVAEHEAASADSFFNVHLTQQRANEGSAKNNIEQFLAVLSVLDIKPADIVVE